MSLRIGYINIRGASKPSWKAACALLHETFDFLFVAETWYVDQDTRCLDRCVVATTCTTSVNTNGRKSGGLMLLATQRARAMIKGNCSITQDVAITFDIGQYRISGVYLPPSMSEEAVTSSLSALTLSTIILGDVNVRFRHCPYQHGLPGPTDRLRTFTAFVQHAGFTRLLPQSSPAKINGLALESRLTTDHCFARIGSTKTRLRLVRSSAVKIDTDHKYVLYLTIFAGTSRCQASTALRYRTRRLQQPHVPQTMCERFDQLGVMDQVLIAEQDVDRLNNRLVSICQSVAESVLGVAPPTSSTTSAKPKRVDPHSGSTIADVAIRVFKAAACSSHENAVLLPSTVAQAKGITALNEIHGILKERYQDPNQPYPPLRQPPLQERFSPEPFSEDEIAKEIQQQSAQKACGSDGLHMRLLKVLSNSTFLQVLCRLYNQCLYTGTTPLAWNESDIYMLVKDAGKRRTTSNVRPITLICMFRKIFERLLLLRFDTTGWARLHPAQAGFRSHYSTCMNAAIVHYLLASKARSTAIFLDFRSAFDIIDHQKLATLLDKRGCPRYLQSLVASLMFRQIKSRVFTNGEASKWFFRTRGVLQGSPLSPYLFNIFVDSLLDQLNAGVVGPPICLFFADDGALVTSLKIDTQSLLNLVYAWSIENRIELNVQKCGHISARYHPQQLFLGPDEIPLLESYDYLGFPMTACGIDFTEHLRRRVSATVGRMRYLSKFSDAWGPAIRLQVFKQYLAPMYEYGAPLVWAWACENAKNRSSFYASLQGFNDLIGWIANGSTIRHLVTANLCGILPLDARFQLLRTGFHCAVHETGKTHPLRITLARVGERSSRTLFGHNLRDDRLWSEFISTWDKVRKPKVALARFLRKWHRKIISKEAQGAHLTRLIPLETRKVPGLYLADVSLSAPITAQELLFQYRRGLFMFNFTCGCQPPAPFHRGHETCHALPQPIQLVKSDRKAKADMLKILDLQPTQVTDVDFLLNTGRLDNAALILEQVKAALRKVNAMAKAEISARTGVGSSHLVLRRR